MLQFKATFTFELWWAIGQIKCLLSAVLTQITVNHDNHEQQDKHDKHDVTCNCSQQCKYNSPVLIGVSDIPFLLLFVCFCSHTFKPLRVPFSPALVLVEAEALLRVPLMTSIPQNSPLSLSRALRVGTFRRQCKCKSLQSISCCSFLTIMALG